MNELLKTVRERVAESTVIDEDDLVREFVSVVQEKNPASLLLSEPARLDWRCGASFDFFGVPDTPVRGLSVNDIIDTRSFVVFSFL